jgi:hypothetical protein
MINLDSKKSGQRRGLNLLHDVITRRLDSTMKAQRAGRMSLLGTSVEAMPPGFAEQFLRKQNPIKLIPKIPKDKYLPPPPAYLEKDFPGKYVAKTLNYLADFGKSKNLIYCIDKRMQNSIKIKYQIVLDDNRKPKYALISIYE